MPAASSTTATAKIPRLIVLGPSHYCERARWGLDAMGLAYREERWAIGPHVPLGRRLAGATALPMLDLGGSVIRGSGAILDWTGMQGGDPATETRLDAVTAPLVRQFMYAGTLGTRAASDIRDLTLDGVAAWQAALGWLAWPAMRRLMIKLMDARETLVPELAGKLEAEFDWLEARLAGRDHLVGDAFGRADATAASLLSPVARPPERAYRTRLRLPPAMETILTGWESRPAMRWVLDTYRRHRGAVI